MANTPIDPDVGLLTITGFAPVTAQPKAANPGVGALTITGFAPTLVQTHQALPGVGLLDLEGFGPVITQSDNGSPQTGLLTLQGLAPSVTLSENSSLEPGPGLLTFTGFAPKVLQVSFAREAFPGPGVIHFAGFAPSVQQQINGIVPGTPASYSNLITSEHRKRPKFKAVVELLVSGFTDEMKTLQTIPVLYDFDLAIGDQLDAVGAWIGLARVVNVPSGAIALSDNDYRLLLRSKIAANHFDGSFQQYQQILSSLFVGSGTTLIAVDNQDMSIDIYVLGNPPTPLQLTLMQAGFLPPKPEGVRINGFILIGGTPIFGLDHDDAFISGPDVGAFINYL
jgi:hypothetical protein